MVVFNLDVPEKNLRNLRSYKCSGDDKSVTRTYILNPYVYETLIHYIPKWMAYVVIVVVGRSNCVNFFWVFWWRSFCADPAKSFCRFAMFYESLLLAEPQIQ